MSSEHDRFLTEPAHGPARPAHARFLTPLASRFAKLEWLLAASEFHDRFARPCTSAFLALFADRFLSATHVLTFAIHVQTVDDVASVDVAVSSSATLAEECDAASVDVVHAEVAAA